MDIVKPCVYREDETLHKISEFRKSVKGRSHSVLLYKPVEQEEKEEEKEEEEKFK